MLALAALVCVAHRATAATWFVNSSGNDANIGTSSQPWATLARANQMAQPGDIVHIADGIYADFPNPAHSGGARIRYIGNLVTPQKVAITFPGKLTGSDVTVSGFDLRAGFTMTATRDSLAWCSVGGGKSELLASNDCVIAHCTFGAERFWMVGGETDTTVKALRDTLTDCVLSLSPTGPGSHTVRFQNLEQAVVQHSQFRLDIAAAAVDASATKFFFVKHCVFADCNWDVTSRCTSGCDETGWFVLRDVTQHNAFVRDSITLRGPGSMQLFASASGSYPGSVIHNRWDQCVVRQSGTSTYNAAMVYQDQAQGDTLTGCILIGQQAGLGFNAGIHAVMLDHCTLVGFGPTQGTLNLNNNASWTTLRVRNSIVCTAGGSGTGSAPVVASLTSALGHLISDHNLYFGPVAATSAISITGLGLSGIGSGTTWCSQLGADCHSLFASPLFTNASAVLSFDPMLSAGSPARNLSDDGSDVGALTYLDVSPPASVRDLRVQPGANAASASPIGGKGRGLPHGAKPAVTPTVAAAPDQASRRPSTSP